MSIKLFIAGDVASKSIQPEVFKIKRELIFQEIKPFISDANFAVVNLEAPVVNDNLTPITKSGPCLGISSSTLAILKKAGFNVFTLANNHFFDQGQQGVDNTIDLCKELSINVVGGGKNNIQSRKPLFLEHEGKSIAIINACEHEFSIADNEHGGSNPLDIINMQEDISKVRAKADYVLMVLHGGIEYYHYPTPRMKRCFRHFIDLGVDAVINHHQHCICGYEVYKGKPIFYGLGNFFFPWDDQSRLESWYYGYAVSLILDKDVRFELVPYKQTAEGLILRDKLEFDKEIEYYNLVLHDDYLLQQKFDDYLIDMEFRLKSDFLPTIFKGRFISALVRRGLFGKLYSGKHVFSIKNRLSCESHYESIRRLFEILVK